MDERLAFEFAALLHKGGDGHEIIVIFVVQFLLQRPALDARDECEHLFQRELALTREILAGILHECFGIVFDVGADTIVYALEVQCCRQNACSTVQCSAPPLRHSLELFCIVQALMLSTGLRKR